jgi:putative FmdB family regulatory protein
MPFYEYECPNCGYRDEVLQKISDKPLKKCPTCGKNGLRKLMSAPVFRLKGSGWYETDFKSDQENKRNLAGADKEEAKPETKADAKVEAKPDAAKPEAAKADSPKADSTKAESAKSESTRSESNKTNTPSTSARKSAARAKPRSKPARTKKRPKRR